MDTTTSILFDIDILLSDIHIYSWCIVIDCDEIHDLIAYINDFKLNIIQQHEGERYPSILC